MTGKDADLVSPVVIRFPSIMDGAVLRWYFSVEEAEKGDDVCSASRNGVWERADETCPLEWVEQAHKVHDLLQRERNDADTSAWETHTERLFGPVEPIHKDRGQA